MKVYKVGDIIERELMLAGGRKREVVGILATLDSPPDANEDFAWTTSLEIEVDDGQPSRLVPVNFPSLISRTADLTRPILLGNGHLSYFRGRLFLLERPPKNAAEEGEIGLRVKKAVYDEASELSSIRAAVTNVEAAIELSKSGARRPRIAEDVKILVWTRDGGACIRCGAKEHLHFDRIIPVSKGGGSSELNIQLLCEACNLKKSDKIASP